MCVGFCCVAVLPAESRMIEARKNRCFEALFYTVLKWVMRRRFHGIYVAGLEHVRELDPRRAVVALANHTNWWDGFVVELLSREFPGRAFYLAQEEKHLARYRWLRWLGAFGIDLDGSALPGLRYALKLLAQPANIVWMFPQGEIAHPTARIVPRPGAWFLAKRSGAQLLPVIFRYEWMIESKPSVFIQFGPPGFTDLEALADSVPIGRDELLARFVPLYRPRMSLNKWVDYLRWLARGGRQPFERENR